MSKVLGRIAGLAITLTSVVTVNPASAQTTGSALYLRQPASVVAPVYHPTVAFASGGAAPVHLASCCDNGGCATAPTCGAAACNLCDGGCAAPGCDACPSIIELYLQKLLLKMYVGD